MSETANCAGEVRAELFAMIVYALIDSRCSWVVDLYLRRTDAERELADALGDESEWEPFLSVVELDFSRSDLRTPEGQFSLS